MKRIRQTLISTLALLLLSCAAGAQQAPPAKPEPAKPWVAGRRSFSPIGAAGAAGIWPGYPPAVIKPAIRDRDTKR